MSMYSWVRSWEGLGKEGEEAGADGKTASASPGQQVAFKSHHGKSLLVSKLWASTPGYVVWGTVFRVELSEILSTFSVWFHNLKNKLLSFPFLKTYQVNSMGVVLTLTPSQITCPEAHSVQLVLMGGLEGVGGTKGERLRTGLLAKPELNQTTRG